MVVARQKSQKSLERVIEALGMVHNEMLEQDQTFCLVLIITIDQLNPLVDPSEKEQGVDD